LFELLDKFEKNMKFKKRMQQGWGRYHSQIMKNFYKYFPKKK